MASKRAVQLRGARMHAVAGEGRVSSRMVGLHTYMRALSVASRPLIDGNFKSQVEYPRGARAEQSGSVFMQRRYRSQPASNSGTKVYDFDNIISILSNPSSSTLLIDVREPHEFETNTIPTAINIPVSSQPDSLLLDEEDFAARFGFAKPPIGKEVVFFCKAGVRSRAAAGLAKGAGYINVGEYPGSWRDWEARGGPGTKSPPPPGGLGEPQKPVTETKPTARTGTSGEEDLGKEGTPQSPGGPGGVL